MAEQTGVTQLYETALSKLRGAAFPEGEPQKNKSGTVTFRVDRQESDFQNGLPSGLPLSCRTRVSPWLLRSASLATEK